MSREDEPTPMEALREGEEALREDRETLSANSKSTHSSPSSETSSTKKENTSPNQQGPLLGAESFYGLIETVEDAVLVVEACRRGLLPRVQCRLGDGDRAMIRPGSVFIFMEGESGIRRWTDGKIWSPSRIAGEFLLYRQLEQRVAPPRKSSSSSSSTMDNIGILGGMRRGGEGEEHGEQQRTGSPGPLLKKDGLMKKTISLNVEENTVHLVCYFREVVSSSGQPNELADRIPSKMPFFAPLKGTRIAHALISPRTAELEGSGGSSGLSRSANQVILPSKEGSNYGPVDPRFGPMMRYQRDRRGEALPISLHQPPVLAGQQRAWPQYNRQPYPFEAFQQQHQPYYQPSHYPQQSYPSHQQTPHAYPSHQQVPHGFPPNQQYQQQIPSHSYPLYVPQYLSEVRQSSGYPHPRPTLPTLGKRPAILPPPNTPKRSDIKLAPLRIANLLNEEGKGGKVGADEGMLLTHFAQSTHDTGKVSKDRHHHGQSKHNNNR